MVCWISEPLIFSTEDAGLGLPLPCLPSSATTETPPMPSEVVLRDGQVYRGRGVSTDSVEASGKAFLNAINRIALQPEALDDAIRADLAAGRRPCAVVATCGTALTPQHLDHPKQRN